MNRQIEIREKMKNDFRTGGKKSKLMWFERWFYDGEGSMKMAYIKQICIALFGLKGLGDYMATSDIAAFMPLIAFFVAYIPITVILGFAFTYFGFGPQKTYITNILDPFVHDVKEALRIKD